MNNRDKTRNILLESEIREEMSMRQEKFRERLVELRLAKGMTQENLAREVGTTSRTISNYETVNSDLSTSRLCMLANALNTTPDYLCGYSDDKGGLSDDDISNK